MRGCVGFFYYFILIETQLPQTSTLKRIYCVTYLWFEYFTILSSYLPRYILLCYCNINMRLALGWCPNGALMTELHSQPALKPSNFHIMLLVYETCQRYSPSLGCPCIIMGSSLRNPLVISCPYFCPNFTRLNVTHLWLLSYQ